MQNIPFLIAISALAGTLIAAAPTSAYTGEKYARQANFTIEQARQFALKARPGTITDQELEQESGGSGLRYSFDIRSRNKTYEVGVDAKTGKILEVSTEGPNPD